MLNAEPIWRHVETHQQDLIGLSDRVWGMPETLYAEYRSCAEHAATLQGKGFRVTEGVTGIPTAVMGEAGTSGPVIAILGEYDALPGLSQQAGIAEPRPVVVGGAGHGCGHNLLGSAALLAACALKDRLEETGTPGRVRYYGCPAEEGGAAKSFMVRDGAFDDVDVAITWHPDCVTKVDEPQSLANTRMDFAFTGRASHAAAAPHLGRSALDAAELMNVGQQIAKCYRLHHRASRAEVRERALAMLENVHIRDPLRVYDLLPHGVSGGMGQRIMIAMMLIATPRLIIADEPTSALDVTVRRQVLAVLQELVDRAGASLIFISHDLNLVADFCDRVLVMYRGRVLEDLPAARLGEAVHPYTRGLLDSLPRLDHPVAELAVPVRDPAWLDAPAVTA